MKSLKGYFKAGKPNKPSNTPPASDAPTLPPGDKRHSNSRPVSSYAAGSFRNEEEIKNMKTEVMAEWLYKQQCLKLWASSGPEEGVALKKTRGEYTCCPVDLRYMRSGLFEQIVQMNVACAMTVSTNVISIFVGSQPGDFACLQGCLSVRFFICDNDVFVFFIYANNVHYLPSSPPTTVASSISIGSSNYGSTTGGVGKTYDCVSCAGGRCFCGLDSDGNPTCFRDEECNKTCSTNEDCDSGRGCIMNSCCGSEGYCISLATDPVSCNSGGRKKRDHGGGFGVYQGSGSYSEYVLNMDRN